MGGQMEVKGSCILSVTCQAEAYGCDVGHLQRSEPKKKVGSSSGVKGKALENKLKTFATNWQSHLSSIYVLCFKVGQEFPTPHTSNFLSLPLKKNTDKNEKN